MRKLTLSSDSDARIQSETVALLSAGDESAVALKTSGLRKASAHDVDRLIDLPCVQRYLSQVPSEGHGGGGSATMFVGIVVAFRRAGICPPVRRHRRLPLATDRTP